MWLFGDSFDHYTDLQKKYEVLGTSGYAIGAGTGRYGTNSAHFTTSNGYMLKAVTPGSATAGAFASMAFRFTPTSSAIQFGFAQLWYGPPNRGHVALYWNPDGSLSVWRPEYLDGGSPLFATDAILGTTPAGLVPAGVWASIEFYVKVHTSTGAVRVRVNGHEVLTLTGQNTQGNAVGSNDWSGWYIGHGITNGTLDLDDLMLYDDFDNGDGVTDFLGDLTAECLFPSGAGASSQWTRSTGATNYGCVNEAAPDDDTSYVSDGTVGHIDTYQHGALTRITSGIKCVQIVADAKKDNAGTRAIAGVIRRAGSNYVGADVYLGTSYFMAVDPRPLDPSTGLAWTAADVDAAEVGQKVTV